VRVVRHRATWAWRGHAQRIAAARCEYIAHLPESSGRPQALLAFLPWLHRDYAVSTYVTPPSANSVA